MSGEHRTKVVGPLPLTDNTSFVFDYGLIVTTNNNVLMYRLLPIEDNVADFWNINSLPLMETIGYGNWIGGNKYKVYIDNTSTLPVTFQKEWPDSHWTFAHTKSNQYGDLDLLFRRDNNDSWENLAFSYEVTFNNPGITSIQPVGNGVILYITDSIPSNCGFYELNSDLPIPVISHTTPYAGEDTWLALTVTGLEILGSGVTYTYEQSTDNAASWGDILEEVR